MATQSGSGDSSTAADDDDDDDDDGQETERVYSYTAGARPARDGRTGRYHIALVAW